MLGTFSLFEEGDDLQKLPENEDVGRVGKKKGYRKNVEKAWFFHWLEYKADIAIL